MADDREREAEFDACCAAHWGWDGYHVEDAVSFAHMFKRQRDEARSDADRLRAALEDIVTFDHPMSRVVQIAREALTPTEATHG